MLRHILLGLFLFFYSLAYAGDGLEIEDYRVSVVPENPRSGQFTDAVRLYLDVKNNSNKRITAWMLKVHLHTKLGTEIGTVKLRSERGGISAGGIEEAVFQWRDNPFIEGQMYDKLSSVSTENLLIDIISQKSVKGDTHSPGKKSEESNDSNSGSQYPNERIELIQKRLKKEGYEVSVDGVFGPNTRAAIKEWQKKHNFEADGQPSRLLLVRMRNN